MEIITTKVTRPPVMIVYGDHKIGKSTFAAGCPRPIFIQAEDGLQNLEVQAFELAQSTKDIFDAIDYLRTEEHDFKTLVVDSLDWCERIFWADICEKKGWLQIGDGDYGAGYKLAINVWKEFVEAITELNKERKMMVVLIAHAKIAKFQDPEREGYDRYDLDLHEKSGNLLCQFSDIIAFVNERTIVTEKQDGMRKVAKAKSTGERVLNLNKKAAFEAGNRYGLPETLPLTWEALSRAFKDINAKRAAAKPGNLTASKEEKKVRDLSAIVTTATTKKASKKAQSKEEPVPERVQALREKTARLRAQAEAEQTTNNEVEA